MLRARLEWKPADCWVGGFARTVVYADQIRTDLWLCLLPMVPLHVTWVRRQRVTPWGRWLYRRRQLRGRRD